MPHRRVFEFVAKTCDDVALAEMAQEFDFVAKSNSLSFRRLRCQVRRRKELGGCPQKSLKALENEDGFS